MLNEFRHINAAQCSLQDLVVMHFYLRSVSEEFTRFGVDEPDWISVQIRQVCRQIVIKHGTYIDEKLLEAQRKLQALKSEEEQRADAQAEVDRWQKLAKELE